MNMKIIAGMLGIVSLWTAGLANASTVSINPTDITVTEPTPVFANIAADFSDVVGGTAQGGVSVFWDPTVLTLNEAASGVSADIVSVLTAQFIRDPLDVGFGFEVVDAAAGSLTFSFSLCTLTYGCDALSVFNMYDLVFDTVAGSTNVDAGLSLIGDVFWNDTGTVMLDPQPILSGATVTVNPVPVPAAVWLFGSGLLGLVGVARRRSA